MGAWRRHRFVVLTVASFIVGGELPTVSDPAEEVVSYFDGERGQIVASFFHSAWEHRWEHRPRH